jgi:hypothetical protein
VSGDAVILVENRRDDFDRFDVRERAGGAAAKEPRAAEGPSEQPQSRHMV